jgi:hypothetical protein
MGCIEHRACSLQPGFTAVVWSWQWRLVKTHELQRIHKLGDKERWTCSMQTGTSCRSSKGDWAGLRQRQVLQSLQAAVSLECPKVLAQRCYKAASAEDGQPLPRCACAIQPCSWRQRCRPQQPAWYAEHVGGCSVMGVFGVCYRWTAGRPSRGRRCRFQPGLTFMCVAPPPICLAASRGRHRSRRRLASVLTPDNSCMHIHRTGWSSCRCATAC